MIRKNMILGFAAILLAATSVTYAAIDSKPITQVDQVKGKEIVIEGKGNKRTIKVTANDVVKIEGLENTVTIEGSFAKLEIEGASNSVNLDDVKKVSVEGMGNKVNANHVDIVHVEGTQNHVHYKSSKNKTGKADTKIEGIDNMVMKIK
ncbi:DUF3060 domain-containing protein [Sphingobacterium faecium]|uniref:DUF3060 domain-containing protein n=2 Tax=Sphingobacterium faecium TaxID=34087 RepID=UPI0014742AEA|nr:DUF3060 domain-containing protein [Sphingobacterium faecium]